MIKTQTSVIVPNFNNNFIVFYLHGSISLWTKHYFFCRLTLETSFALKFKKWIGRKYFFRSFGAPTDNSFLKKKFACHLSSSDYDFLNCIILYNIWLVYVPFQIIWEWRGRGVSYSERFISQWTCVKFVFVCLLFVV